MVKFASTLYIRYFCKSQGCPVSHRLPAVGLKLLWHLRLMITSKLSFKARFEKSCHNSLFYQKFVFFFFVWFIFCSIIPSRFSMPIASSLPHLNTIRPGRAYWRVIPRIHLKISTFFFVFFEEVKLTLFLSGKSKIKLNPMENNLKCSLTIYVFIEKEKQAKRMSSFQDILHNFYLILIILKCTID